VLLGFTMAEPAPILGISIGQEGNITTLTHLNGAILPAGSYKILVDGVDKTTEFSATGAFSPGMTLMWDSGTKAVGTVSVVYTSDKGVSTLLAEKTIGKAGSGGSGGDGFEDIYTIITKMQWADFLIKAQNHKGSLGNGIVYVDNGEYWVSIHDRYIYKDEATANPSIQQYMVGQTDHRLTKIDLSKKIYNTSDIETPGGTWKSPYPTIGSLYEYNGALYMDIISKSNKYNPNRNPDASNWVKIAYIK